MSFFRGLWRSNSKHKKLCEEWALANSCESVGPSTSSGSGSCSTASASTSASASSSRTGPPDQDQEPPPETTFTTLKYLGSTLVESPSSETETAEAIKTVMSMAKARGSKLPRVSLAVSLRGIRMTDLTSEEELLRISIYRISYCSADATHPNVFAFISTNLNETMECHAYLCPKRKVAQSVCLTVAQAFNTAYELWKLVQLDSRIYHAQDKSPTSDEQKEEDKKGSSGDAGGTKDEEDEEDEEEEQLLLLQRPGKASPGSRKVKNAGQKSLLIDLKDTKVKAKVESWVSFDEDANVTPDEGIPLKPLKSPTSDTVAPIGNDNDSAFSSAVTTPNNNNSRSSITTTMTTSAWEKQPEKKKEEVTLDLVSSS